MKELYEIGEIGRMERQHQVTDLGRIAFLERGLDGVQEVGANASILVAQFDLGCGVLHGFPIAGLIASSGKGRDQKQGSTPRKRVADRRFRPATTGAACDALDACCLGISSQKMARWLEEFRK